LPDRFQTELIDYFESQKHQKVLHILTDIDDTLFPSSMGGSDISWIQHQFYPGVLQFIYELSPNYITMLSARPKFLKNRTSKKFTNICVPNDVLSGTASHILTDGLPNWVRIKNNKYDKLESYANFANRKIENFQKYRMLFPEYKFIFFGDIGQGDLVVANQITRDPSVLCAIIHDISRYPHQQSLYTERSLNEDLEPFLNNKIRVVKNYVVAAWYIHKHLSILDNEALLRIIESANQQIYSVKCSNDEISPFIRKIAESHLMDNIKIRSRLVKKL
jgi:hypothetical protein